MGVPGFFSWLIKKYDKKDFTLYKLDGLVDVLYIDSNCFFHPQCFKVLEENEENDDLENKMIKKILEYLEYLIEYSNPIKLIYISVDGVAPLSKINQQRYRRYKSSSDNILRNLIKKKYDKKCTTWSNMVITPGTVFMETLHKAILKFIKKYKKINIIYSSYLSIGEGEHKILQHIKKNKYDNIVIYGLDADLFFLSFASKKENIYLLREESIFGKTDNDKLVYVSIDSVLFHFNKYLSTHIENENINFNDDIIFICYILGNDFLPHLPSIDIKHNGLDVIFDSYIKTFIKFKSKLINNMIINMDFLLEFISGLAKIENKYFKIVINNHRCKINNCDTEYEREIWDLENMKLFDIEDTVKLGYDNDFLWKYRYYEKNFHISENQENAIDKLCYEYLKGLSWVTKYYFDECPDWRWFYVYPYAPFLSDLYNYCLKTKINLNNIKFNTSRPVTPFVQLLSVIPPSHSFIIPKSYEYLAFDSNIIDLFPVSYQQNMIHKNQFWECNVIIPYLDIDRIEKEVSGIKINKNELERNLEIEEFVFNVL